VVAILAACSSLPIPGLGGASQPQAQAQVRAQGTRQAGFFNDPSKMPVDQKLGIGILKLEGSPQAITAKQAQDLLPLWKAVKSLGTSNNTSPQEITALYKQIQDTLTPDQVQAIQKLTWTQQDMQSIMQKYGIQFNQGGLATQDPSARATRIAQFQSQGGNRQGGGNFGGGGGFGGGNFGGQTGQNGNGQNRANPQRTPDPNANRNRGGGGFNNIFADAVIKLLQQKAGG
jgi:hypothetical protein